MNTNDIIKASRLEDVGVFVCNLPTHREYEIDGEVHIQEKEYPIQLTSISDIRRVTNTQKLTKYTSDTLPELSPQQYNEQLAKLSINLNDDGFFGDIEEQIVHMRFVGAYSPVSEPVRIVSEPLIVDVAIGVLETNNKFISSLYSIGKSTQVAVYQYDRTSAAFDTIRQVFDKLGMKFDPDVSSYSPTAENRLWGFSNGKPSIANIIAFGHYLKFDKYKFVRKGSIDTLEQEYKQDCIDIEQYITIMYNKCFTPVEFVDSKDCKDLYEHLITVERNLNSLDVKVKAQHELRHTQTVVNKCKAILQRHYLK